MRWITIGLLALTLCGCADPDAQIDRMTAARTAQCGVLDKQLIAAVEAPVQLDRATEEKIDALVKANAPMPQISAVQDAALLKWNDEIAAKERASKACWASVSRTYEMQADQAERRWQAYQATQAAAAVSAQQPNPYADALSGLPQSPSPSAPNTVDAISPVPAPPQQHCIGQIPVNANVAMPCP